MRTSSQSPIPEGWGPCRRNHYPTTLTNGGCTDCHTLRNRERHAELRAQVFAAYGGACACCGETYEAFLTVDHVAGGGSKEYRAGVGPLSGARWIRKVRSLGFPPDYQLLCSNCNHAKGCGRDCPPGHNQHARDYGKVGTCV